MNESASDPMRIRQNLAALFLTSFSFVAPVSGEEAPKEIDLLIGQSNMAGRAPIMPELSPPLDGVFLLNDKNEWEPATNPLNELPKVVPNTACVSAEGLTAIDGNTHFDTSSQLELGKRYATALLDRMKP